MPVNADISPPKGLAASSPSDVASVLSYAFRKDDFHRYVMLSHCGFKAEEIIDIGKSQEFFTELLRDLVAEGAAFLWTLPDSTLASVWQFETLHSAIGTTDDHASNDRAALRELSEASEQALLSVLPVGTQLMHLLLVGKRENNSNESSERLTAPGLISPVMDLAAGKGWPMYAESTSPASRDIFSTKLGFKMLQPMQLGVGRVDQNGVEQEGGSGVTIWIMLWLPPSFLKT